MPPLWGSRGSETRRYASPTWGGAMQQQELGVRRSWVSEVTRWNPPRLECQDGEPRADITCVLETMERDPGLERLQG